jgi:predicted nuclease with TOPRIM domain
MPEISTEEITKVLKDTLYVGVGLGVIGFQKAQVRRVELTKALKSQLGEAKGRVDGLGDVSDDLLGDAKAQVAKLVEGAEDRVKLIEERLSALEEQIETLLDQLEDKLPEQARELVKQARDAAKDARTQLSALVNRAA